MERFLIRLRRFCRRDDGPAAVEYAVMLALIILVCIVGIRRLGTRANVTFRNTARSVGS
jgi:pilus assembly protein Flp/PilA